MNKIKMIAAMFIAGILLTFVSCGDNGKSKKISIAYANWSEGIAMTNLAKAIFEDQGYDVKLLNADLAPIFTSISRKKADVFMDVLAERTTIFCSPSVINLATSFMR